MNRTMLDVASNQFTTPVEVNSHEFSVAGRVVVPENET